MSGILQTLFLGAAAAVKDAYFNLVTLLLNTNATNGAQNNTFLDSSTNNFSITRNGNTTQGTFTPFSQTGWGNFFDGSADGFSYSGTTFGSGAWTVELWFYFTGTSFTGPIGFFEGTTDSLVLAIMSSTTIRVDEVNVSNDLYTVPTMSANTWYHVAATKDASGNQTLFLNGVRSSTGVTTTSRNFSTATLRIGYSTIGQTDFTGYISNLRFVTGTAVYNPLSSTITVPTAPLTAISGTQLLTCQSNRFVDNSTNAFALTINGTPSVEAFSPFAPTTAYSTSLVGGSGYFDGSGDYLSCGSQSAYAFGTGNFTLEAWVYVPNRNAQYNIAATRGSPGTVNGWNINITTSGGIVVFTNAFVFNNVGTVPINAWTHIAFTREGTGTNQTKIYINGVNVASATNNEDFSNTTLGVGNANDGSQYPFLGYISGVRLVKGTAVYTAAFTPPTAPPTDITNTSLLLNFTNAGIYDAAAKNVAETVGNAQVSTTQAKFGTTSMYFDGTGDYLLPPASQNFVFNGDFTIEAWFYATSNPSFGGIVSTRESSNTRGVSINLDNTQKIRFFINGTDFPSGYVSYNLNQWYHVAIVRNGSGTNNVTAYVNGTSVGTTTNTATTTETNLVVGRFYTDLNDYYLNGYVDEVRITKGYARYTANFTPPTAAFPLQ